jgi:hypothetical protein
MFRAALNKQLEFIQAQSAITNTNNELIRVKQLVQKAVFNCEEQ